MPRRARKVKFCELHPDPDLGKKMVTKFINYLMWDGKKQMARKILLDALEKASKQSSRSREDVFDEVVKAVCPKLEVKSKRVGGATYQVPVVVSDERAIALSMAWIIKYARKRRKKEKADMSYALYKEFLDILDGKGESLKQREVTHKMAEANKAFAHFKW